MPSGRIRSLVLFMCFGVANWPVEAQVFVQTVLDRPSSVDSATLDVPTTVASLPTDTQTLLGSIPADATFPKLTRAQRDQIANAILDKTLVKLEGKPDEEVLKLCDTVNWALKNRWAPVGWRSERSVCFWSQPGLDWARAAQIAAGSDGAAASVEVASGVFWGLRLRIQTAVSGSSDEDDATAEAQETMQRLITSGGNLSIGVTYPWYAYESPTKHVAGILTSFARVGGSIPALGGEATSQTIRSNDANGSIELAPIDAQLQIQSFNRTISLALAGRFDVVRGSDEFNTAIGNAGRDGFYYGQLGVGLRFAQVVWVVASWKHFSSSSIPGDGITYTLMFGK